MGIDFSENKNDSSKVSSVTSYRATRQLTRHHRANKLSTKSIRFLKSLGLTVNNNINNNGIKHQ